MAGEVKKEQKGDLTGGVPVIKWSFQLTVTKTRLLTQHLQLFLAKSN